AGTSETILPAIVSHVEHVNGKHTTYKKYITSNLLTFEYEYLNFYMDVQDKLGIIRFIIKNVFIIYNSSYIQIVEHNLYNFLLEITCYVYIFRKKRFIESSTPLFPEATC
ncbi:hypothetical protein ACJX0J_005303, partial [Zea mays]